MNLIIMPGCQGVNSIWEKDILRGYNKKFEKIVLFSFNTCGGDYCEEVDLEKELERFKKLINNLDSDYVIFARKISCLLVLKAFYELGIKPRKCVFLGMPVSWALINNFPINNWLENYNIPTIFVQRKLDPLFYFNDLKNYLNHRNVKDYIIADIDYLDSEYDKIDVYKRIAMNFLSDFS